MPVTYGLLTQAIDEVLPRDARQARENTGVVRQKREQTLHLVELGSRRPLRGSSDGSITIAPWFWEIAIAEAGSNL